jgi:hypothetical protein
MISTSITIQSIEDAKKGKPLIEGVVRENIHECERFSVGILEAGTVGGQTSIMFICQDGGKAVVGQMTANQFEMLIGAFRGAIQRFGS